MRSGRKSKAPGRPRKYVPRKRGLRKSKRNNVPDKASCSVTRTLALANTNQMYAFDSFQLADFQRASDIARNYQRFRMTGIKVTWKPVYDTYSAATPQQKPNLYYIVDKSGSLPDNITLEALKQSGARVVAFDEKPIHVRWRPSVLNETLNIAGAPSASGFKVSPLLATNGNATNPGLWIPSTVAHQGLKWYMEAGGAAQTLNMEVEIQFEFFKPIYPSLAAAPALGLSYAKLDASPDGVEGGTDGITIPLPNSA